MQKTLKIACAAVVLAAALLIGISIAYPALAAVACPTCVGFRAAGDRMFVDRSMSLAETEHAIELIDAARQRVRNFYGTTISNPEILICADQACYGRFGGGSRGMALLDWALLLSPRGTSVTIASHEMSHIELHRRIGLIKTYRRAVPQWFDEGVAVFVSDDERYLKPASRGDRCRVGPDGALPTTRAAWIETAQSADLYAKAACRVSRWIAAHGGSESVRNLLAAVANGTAFATAYDGLSATSQ